MDAALRVPVWRGALRAGPLVMAFAVAVLGVVMPWACGCGRDLAAASGTVATTLLAAAAWPIALAYRRAAAARSGDAAPWRDAVQIVAIVAAGLCVWLAARAGPGLGLLAAVAAGTVAFATHRAQPSAARTVAALAMLAWLAVVAGDHGQRHRFDTIAAIAAVGPALQVAAVAWWTAPGARARVISFATLSVAAHAWLAAWWLALWLPTTAWWALGSALPAAGVLALGASPGMHERRGAVVAAWTAWTAALVHLLLLAAAFLAVARLR